MGKETFAISSNLLFLVRGWARVGPEMKRSSFKGLSEVLERIDRSRRKLKHSWGTETRVGRK